MILRGRHKAFALAAVLAAYLLLRYGGLPLPGLPELGLPGVPPMFPPPAPRVAAVEPVTAPAPPKPAIVLRGARLRDKGEAFLGAAQ